MDIAKEQAKMRRNAARRAHTIFVDYNVCSATEEEHYYNLVSDIFYMHDDLCLAYGRDFSIVNLRKTMNELLSERDVDIIKLRYGLDKNIPHTLEEVGQMIGLTRQRIWSRIKKAFNKLYIKSFKYSLTKSREEYSKQSITLLELPTRTYNTLLYMGLTSIRDLVEADLEAIHSIGELGSLKIRKQIVLFFHENSTLVNEFEISCLNLSTRSYNALKNAGINTIGQLIPLNEKDIVKLKNIGVKSAKEISTKLKEYQNQNIC